ncbi:unnamed protein product [Cuscuta europaea]|uniref:Uncharacterized protein n=1 Tax=Cuscuta europaea TaxID=41803 RepID=A0A9P1ENL2_CUSEU|nr:unnamed protein product [Cuscuta europaea]
MKLSLRSLESEIEDVVSNLEQGEELYVDVEVAVNGSPPSLELGAARTLSSQVRCSVSEEFRRHLDVDFIPISPPSSDLRAYRSWERWRRVPVEKRETDLDGGREET